MDLNSVTRLNISALLGKAASREPGAEPTQIVTATDGRQARFPESLVKRFKQSEIDAVIEKLYRNSFLDRQACKALGVTHVKP